MGDDIWTRLETVKSARATCESAEKEWQTYLRGLVAAGNKGPFVGTDGVEKFIYVVKGGNYALSNKRTGPGKKKDKVTSVPTED